MNLTLQAKMMQVIASRGWTVAPMLHSAVKTYETAAGGRTAQVLCYPGDLPASFSLRACYESEGSNVLSTAWLRLQEGTDAVTLTAQILAFLDEVEVKVANTYAVRILALIRDAASTERLELEAA